MNARPPAAQRLALATGTLYDNSIRPNVDFKIYEIVFTDGTRSAQSHHCAKLRQNRSFHCGDIAIFRVF